MNNIFMLLLMVYLHIIDDWVLQGLFINMKQRSWWLQRTTYKSLYCHDYIAALLLHSFSWTFLVMLPIASCLQFDLGWWLIGYVANLLIHAFVDNLKANALKINLVTDQVVHILQIVITWGLFTKVYC